MQKKSKYNKINQEKIQKKWKKIVDKFQMILAFSGNRLNTGFGKRVRKISKKCEKKAKKSKKNQNIIK